MITAKAGVCFFRRGCLSHLTVVCHIELKLVYANLSDIDFLMGVLSDIDFFEAEGFLMKSAAIVDFLPGRPANGVYCYGIREGDLQNAKNAAE